VFYKVHLLDARHILVLQEPSKHPPPTVIDITNVKEPKQMTVQNELNELNNQDYKGKPKVTAA